jgi:hypothetical protein
MHKLLRMVGEQLFRKLVIIATICVLRRKAFHRNRKKEARAYNILSFGLHIQRNKPSFSSNITHIQKLTLQV